MDKIDKEINELKERLKKLENLKKESKIIDDINFDFPKKFVRNLCNFNKQYMVFMKTGCFDKNSEDYKDLIYYILTDIYDIIDYHSFDFKPAYILELFDYMFDKLNEHRDIFEFFIDNGVLLGKAFIMYPTLMTSFEKRYKDIIYNKDGSIDETNDYLNHFIFNHIKYNEKWMKNFNFSYYSLKHLSKHEEYSFLIENYKGIELLNVLSECEDYDYLSFINFLNENSKLDSIDEYVLLAMFNLEILKEDVSTEIIIYNNSDSFRNVLKRYLTKYNSYSNDNMLYYMLKNIKLIDVISDDRDDAILDLESLGGDCVLDRGCLDELVDVLISFYDDADSFIERHLEYSTITVDFLLYLIRKFDDVAISMPSNGKKLLEHVDIEGYDVDYLSYLMKNNKNSLLRVFSKEELFDLYF